MCIYIYMLYIMTSYVLYHTFPLIKSSFVEPYPTETRVPVKPPFLHLHTVVSIQALPALTLLLDYQDEVIRHSLLESIH